MDIEKTSNATWKIDKQGNMKVPAYIFANDNIIKGIKEGRTLDQIKNVASLPGIVKHASVMPDGHEGYGFPIGGVAAFDAETGLVSPGGVGYDINCLVSGTKVLTSFGCSRPIESFEKDFSFIVQTNGTVLMQGKTTLQVASEEKDAIHFMHKKHKGVIYKIETHAGIVEVTQDHPIITPNGKTNPADLAQGDQILVYPFDGIDYKYFCENEEELAIYAKLIGYLTGDGTLTTCGGKKLRTIFFGKRRDLEYIAKDITKLGYTFHLTERTRDHNIEGNKFTSTTAELHIYSKEFAKRLIELGTPKGNKTLTAFSIPEWIKKSPLWIKRLYLAGFFGAELSSSSTLSKTAFYMPTINMNKTSELEQNCRCFLLDIAELLSEFGINVSKLNFVEKIENKVRLRLQISSNEKNLETLYTKIGFEYNQEHLVRSLSAVLYIRLKREYKKKRDNLRQKIVDYKKKGFSVKELQTRFHCEWATDRFVSRAYYEDRSCPRLPSWMPSFEDFLKKQVSSFHTYGALVSNILNIEERMYDGEVYDFTVDEVHKFVANGTMVSNCGIRLLTTPLTVEQIRPKIKELCDKLFKNVPSGVGSEGRLKISHEELDQAVVNGIDWAIEKGYGRKEDKESTEEYGKMPGADPSKVSATAKKRGKSQFGTLGAGNHFLEIQEIHKVLDEKTAKQFGLEQGNAAVMIHCGSRGYGHQICSDNIGPLLNYAKQNNLPLPDKQLVYAPMGHELAENYFAGMVCAVNYAFINRHVIMHWVRETFDQVFGNGTGDSMNLLYDVAHNIAKIEEHSVDGEKQKLVVHRKGATRAFPAGRPELSAKYRDIGQPVIIPGSMGTASYVLVGKPKALEVSWGTTCHGSGRTMSRGQAIHSHDGAKLTKELWENNNIYVRATKPKVVAEEAPDAYKNVDDVVQSVADAGISDLVVRLKPIGVVKG